MPAALREAPVMQGWNQLNPVPATGAAADPAAAAAAAGGMPMPTADPAAADPAAADPAAAAAAAGDGQFASLTLTPEGAGPSAVAAQAAEQAMTLEGQQQAGPPIHTTRACSIRST